MVLEKGSKQRVNSIIVKLSGNCSGELVSFVLYVSDI